MPNPELIEIPEVNPPLVFPSLPPTTTHQEDLTKAGQRRINMVWEYTQSFVAGTIILAYIYTEIIGAPSAGLANICCLIVGFYFSRTNHTQIGGIGIKPTAAPYEGR